ncbi:MAG: CBS domain-containing protein [Deltaproteobacteria bacterium]|nr:CBS domain-containing protein [Deltaproteobacteria bacterium]
MFVSRSMSENVITISPRSTLAEAESLMAKHRIRHLPVVGEDGRLTGIITDRDLRSAMPSSLCEPEEVSQALEKCRNTAVERVMTKNVVTLSVSHTVQDALLLIQSHKVGALPVVDEDNRLLGIVSVRDLLASFISVMGIGDPGALLCILAEHKMGEIKKIVDILTEENVFIGSILVSRHWEGDKRAVFPYVHTINVAGVKKRLSAAGFTLVDPTTWYMENLGRKRKEQP